MSKTLENEQLPPNGYREIANERFLPSESEAVRDEYIARGLTDTNNLKLYLTRNPKPEAMPGIPDPYDYRYRDFGEVVEAFRTEYAELWDAVQTTFAARQSAEREYRISQNQRDPHADEYGQAAYEREWEYVTALSDSYGILAGMLAERGFDPLVVCI